MHLLLRKEFSNLVFYWLLSLLIFVALIVVVGGLTRLTDSGLSITRWEIVTGILPPFSDKGWADAFNLYKQIPQFYLSNSDITLAEFKIISTSASRLTRFPSFSKSKIILSKNLAKSILSSPGNRGN